MADFFLSYSSKDVAKVRQAYEALTAAGYSVDWDQKIPVTERWNTWIKAKLDAAKLVIVFWSRTSADSPNVQHEATIARDDGKLLQAMIEPLGAKEIPIGLYSDQAAKLWTWNGSPTSEPWQQLMAAVRSRLEDDETKRRLRALEDRIQEGARERDILVAEIAKLKAEAQRHENVEAGFRRKVADLERRIAAEGTHSRSAKVDASAPAVLSNAQLSAMASVGTSDTVLDRYGKVVAIAGLAMAIATVVPAFVEIGLRMSGLLEAGGVSPMIRSMAQMAALAGGACLVIFIGLMIVAGEWDTKDAVGGIAFGLVPLALSWLVLHWAPYDGWMAMLLLIPFAAGCWFSFIMYTLVTD